MPTGTSIIALGTGLAPEPDGHDSLATAAEINPAGPFADGKDRSSPLNDISVSTRKAPRPPPSRHHLDRRAADLAIGDGDDDELLSTKAMATWLGTSEQWLEIGRSKGWGPPYLG